MAALQEPLAAAFQFIRYQHGDQIDVCHGIGLSLKETCFQGVGHAAHAQLPQGAIKFDQIHGFGSSKSRRC